MNVSFLLAAVCAASFQTRDFNGGWQWRPEKETAWRTVDLPHDFMLDATNVVEVSAAVKGGDIGCRWYTGGGLCRSVQLKIVREQRIARHGVYVTTRENRFADLADEMGLLVVDEFVDKWCGNWAGRRA